MDVQPRFGHRHRRGLVAVSIALLAIFPLAGIAAAQTGCPTWSDGGSLIYCADSGDAIELFERRPDGTARQLTYVGGQASSPSISPNEATITFEVSFGSDSEPQVYSIDRHGPRVELVEVGDGVVGIIHGMTMAPIRVEEGSFLYREPVHAQQLTAAGSNSVPVFSPAGDRIDFTSNRLGAPAAVVDERRWRRSAASVDRLG
jgi:hypothetical protein